MSRQQMLYLEELAAEANMQSWHGGQKSGEQIIVDNPDLMAFADEVYRITHWINSPSCRKNHPSWGAAVETLPSQDSSNLAGGYDVK